MIRTLLVANRGAIAIRVMRTAHALGIGTVAVFSDADERSPHTRAADVAVRLGPAPAAQSYLDADRVLDAAKRTGADAVHPGYGFLSENADFARAVRAAGLTWVGPSPESIEIMGDKATAKARMRDAGVPVVPGVEFEGTPTEAALAEAADEIGLPLLVKAAFGGGGRGMRRVDSRDELTAAVSAAHAEAEASFGRGEVLLEKLVVGARHVEVQVFGDEHGHVVHLGERECSVQRRHQKVIEEAPSPAVSPELRGRMGAAAVAAARSVDYVGAGTVEFLLGPDGAFFFLEMNTRLQVEHPVTEGVTGLDLVALQLRVAEGAPLGIAQEDVVLRGHAIEARLYAEEPRRGFLPRTGDILLASMPRGEGVRVDHAVPVHGEVTAHYDPMLAKVIAQGPDRATAVRRLRRALTRLTLLGVEHNAGFLAGLLEHPEFLSGDVHTGWLESLDPPAVKPAARLDVAVAARVFLGRGGGWRSAGPSRSSSTLFADTEERFDVRCEQEGDVVTVTVSGEAAEDTFRLSSVHLRTRRVHAEVDGVRRSWSFARRGDGEVIVQRPGGEPVRFTKAVPGAGAAEAEGDGAVRAAMSGKVVSVAVSIGDRVSRGDVVLTLEAMKLQSPLEAGVSGAVSAVRVASGDQVSSGDVLVEIAPDEA